MKTVGVMVILAVLLVAGFMLAGKKKPADQNNNSTPQTNQQPDLSTLPKFVMGDVTRVEGQKVFISAEGEKTIVATAATKVVKQVKAKDGSLSLADAKLAELKAGNKIVAYYSDEPVGSEYSATKIQIID